MYGALNFIINRLVKLWDTKWRQQLQMKNCSCLQLDSIQLPPTFWTSGPNITPPSIRLDIMHFKANHIHIPYYVSKKSSMRNKNIIDLKIQFIIYRNLNVTVFFKKLSYNKYVEWSSTRSRMYVVTYDIVFAMRNESTMVNRKKIRCCIIVLHDHYPTIYPIWPDNLVQRVSILIWIYEGCPECS